MYLRLLWRSRALKQAIVARAELPQPAFDPACMRHAQVDTKFIQQAEYVVDLDPFVGRQVIDEFQHRAFPAVVFVEVDLSYVPVCL
jgi:hypothetical protein